MADRQETQHFGVALGDFGGLWYARAGGKHIAYYIGVAQHHTLWPACGSGGIDNGGQIFRFYHPAHIFHFLLGGIIGSHIQDLTPVWGTFHIVKSKNSLQRGTLRFDLVDLFQ